VKIVIRLLERIAPRFLWKRRIAKWNIDTGESEVLLLPWLCDNRKQSIDVGAADGSYVAHMLLYSSTVVAFEPRPDAATRLRSQFGNTKAVRVEDVALSDTVGSAKMRIPEKGASSTIETRNHLDTFSALVEVPTNRLDNYGISPLGFIKIDVEGHELAVLGGARETLIRERPMVLVEAEDRHNPGSVSAVIAYFVSLQFDGYFLHDGKLRSVNLFDIAQYQDVRNLDCNARRTGIYINNFLFVPTERRSYLASQIAVE